MNRKQQGDIGVAMAIAHYTKSGFVVSVPMTDNSRYDLLIDDGDKIFKVQCKTTGYKPNDIYRVQLATTGGNQSWDKVTKKKLSKDEIDLLFVYAMDGQVYEFPPSMFHNKGSITLGESKLQYKIVF